MPVAAAAAVLGAVVLVHHAPFAAAAADTNVTGQVPTVVVDAGTGDELDGGLDLAGSAVLLRGATVFFQR
jgi:hypothetical protein